MNDAIAIWQAGSRRAVSLVMIIGEVPLVDLFNIGDRWCPLLVLVDTL